MYPSFAEFLHFTYDSDPVLLNVVQLNESLCHCSLTVLVMERLLRDAVHYLGYVFKAGSLLTAVSLAEDDTPNKLKRVYLSMFT